MRRILVICGAGASSTFLVHWMRKVAKTRGLDMRIQAGSRDDVSSRLDDTDVVLVGSHLADSFPDLLSEANAANVQALLMPSVGFDADGAGAVLELVAGLAAAPAAASESEPSGSRNSGSSHG